MTAINIIRRADHVEMWTDAATSEAGEITRIATKVVRWPHFPAIGAVTGDGMMAPVLTDMTAGATSYDGLLSILVEAVEVGIQEFGPEIAQRGGLKPFDIHVAGWSDKAGDFAVHTCSGGDGKPVRLVEATRLVLQPWSDAIRDRLDARGVIPDLMLELGTETSAVMMSAVLEEQRAGAREIGAGVVGGFKEQTILTRQGIWSRAFSVWPDRLGDVV